MSSMAALDRETIYTDDQRRWRSQRAEIDRLQDKFYQDLNNFPNLFSVRTHFHDTEEIEVLLQRQRIELGDGCFQYQLETMRCRNLIIFFLILLGRKQEALKYCESLKEDASKSVIFLTLLAVLQWELNYKTECSETMEILQDLYKLVELEYILAVAEAEKGHLLICIGPQGFLRAMDLLEKAIRKCPQSEVYLWKFDLALAIRRNFSIYAHSEHPKLASSVLASRAFELLTDIARHCPNEMYRARGLVELVRLISHLGFFVEICREEDRENIKSLCEKYDERALVDEALSIDSGKDDHYVQRECGRHFLYARDLNRAVVCFDNSCCKRKNAFVNQLFAKAYLYMYTAGIDIISPPTVPLPALEPSRANAGQSSDHLSEPAARSPEDTSGCRQCQPGKCFVEQNAIEAQRLAEEFDHTPYMAEDGTLQTTQPDGMGNIHHGHIPPNRAQSAEEAMLFDTYEENTYMSRNGTYRTTQLEGIGQIQVALHHCHSSAGSSSENKPTYQAQSDEEAMLFKKYDEDIYMNDDGTFRTTQPEGIATIQLPQHRSSADISPENKQTSQSYPPSVCSVYQRRGNSSKARVRSVLKLQSVSYDISDHRIQVAEYFYHQAFKFDSRNQAVLYEMGKLYEGMNNRDKALEFYQQIISDKNRMASNTIQLVNAYERCGLCLVSLSEACVDAQQKKKLMSRAEDMFMSSLLECRKAVAHLPKLSSNRAVMWESYPKLLNILHQSGHADTHQLLKEAEAHEVVGKHLEAIKVYQEMMTLARTETDRTGALCGSLSNHLSMGNVKEAKFILDIFLTSDERDFILNHDRMQEIREVAVKVFTQAGTQALERNDLSDARDAFKSALLMKGKLLDHRKPETNPGDAAAAAQNVSGQADEEFEQYDISIFYDDDSPSTVTEQLTKMSSCLATIVRDVFGMRVSVNDEGVPLGRPNFDSQLHLAESAPLVMLVIASGPGLSPRMTYIVDTALRTHRKDHLLLTQIGDPCTPPNPLFCLQPYYGAEELLDLNDSNTASMNDSNMTGTNDSNMSMENDSNVRKICQLFDFLLKGSG